MINLRSHLVAHLVEALGVAASASTLGYLASLVQRTIRPRSNTKNAYRAALIAEIVLYVAIRLRLRTFNGGVLRPEPPDRERILELKERFARLKDVLCLRTFLADWHLGADWDHILRGNVDRFIALAYFEEEPENLDAQQKELLGEVVGTLERAWGVKFLEGHSPYAEFPVHITQMEVVHKPLSVYIALEGVGFALTLLKRTLGYRPVVEGGLTFWVYEPAPRRRGSKKDGAAAEGGEVPGEAEPLVFFHGLGTAFPPLLRDLRAVGSGRPVIALQGKHLSQCFQWRRAPSADDVARATAALLKRLGYRRACLMGHSYGTFYVARTCALFPEVAESCVLLDPVCLCSCLPQLTVASFCTYPRLRDFPSLNFWTALALVAARTDFITGQVMRRLDRWYHTQMWPEDMPQRALVVICGKDLLLPVPQILEHLRQSGHPAQVLLEPSLGHGGMFFNPSFRRRTMEALQEFCHPAASAAGSAPAVGAQPGTAQAACSPPEGPANGNMPPAGPASNGTAGGSPGAGLGSDSKKPRSLVAYPIL